MLGHRGRSALPLPDVGTVVEVRSQGAAGSDDDADDGAGIRTRVEAAAATTLEVVAPTHPDGSSVRLAVGTPLVIRWTTELGALLARATVTGTGRDVVGTWTIDVSRVERIQRRDAYRLSAIRPAVLRAADLRVDAETRDISETGVRVVLRGAPRLGSGDEVELLLDLADGTAVFALAEVRRLQPYHAADAGPGDVEVALALRDPDDATRDVLRRFVLEEQLRRRARGAR